MEAIAAAAGRSPISRSKVRSSRTATTRLMARRGSLSAVADAPKIANSGAAIQASTPRM